MNVKLLRRIQKEAIINQALKEKQEMDWNHPVIHDCTNWDLID